MTKKKDTLPHHRELSRARDTLVHTACRLLYDHGIGRRDQDDHLQPGVVLELRFDSPFKTVVSWYSPYEQASELQRPEPPVESRYYEVRKAHNRVSYWWHRYKLGRDLYLHELQDSHPLPKAVLLARREYYLDLRSTTA